MYDYNNGYDEVFDEVDEDEICATHRCDKCPLAHKCYDMRDEVEDDYETMSPDEFIDKYMK